MPSARAHLIISGHVQGVFYRGFTEETAVSLGLTGWVRNTSEGDVEALFEGDRASIEKAIRSCYDGPPAARVDNIDVRWEEFKGEFRSFSVRYF
jgi:acylphosphatase